MTSAYHEGVSCDGCEVSNFAGNRFKCLRCSDFDLCQQCFETKNGLPRGHNRDHPMQLIMTQHQFELLYDGDASKNYDACKIATFTCPYCGSNGLNVRNFQKHIQQHSIPAGINVICPLCVALPEFDANRVHENLKLHFTQEHNNIDNLSSSYRQEPPRGLQTTRRPMLASRRSRPANYNAANYAQVAAGATTGIPQINVPLTAESLNMTDREVEELVRVMMHTRAGSGATAPTVPWGLMQQVRASATDERIRVARERDDTLSLANAAIAAVSGGPPSRTPATNIPRRAQYVYAGAAQTGRRINSTLGGLLPVNLRPTQRSTQNEYAQPRSVPSRPHTASAFSTQTQPVARVVSVALACPSEIAAADDSATTGENGMYANDEDFDDEDAEEEDDDDTVEEEVNEDKEENKRTDVDESDSEFELDSADLPYDEPDRLLASCSTTETEAVEDESSDEAVEGHDAEHLNRFLPIQRMVDERFNREQIMKSLRTGLSKDELSIVMKAMRTECELRTEEPVDADSEAATTPVLVQPECDQCRVTRQVKIACGQMTQQFIKLVQPKMSAGQCVREIVQDGGDTSCYMTAQFDLPSVDSVSSGGYWADKRFLRNRKFQREMSIATSTEQTLEKTQIALGLLSSMIGFEIDGVEYEDAGSSLNRALTQLDIAAMSLPNGPPRSDNVLGDKEALMARLGPLLDRTAMNEDSGDESDEQQNTSSSTTGAVLNMNSRGRERDISSLIPPQAPSDGDSSDDEDESQRSLRQEDVEFLEVQNDREAM